MGHQIIKQLNGLFCVYSTIVDDVVMYDATPTEIIEYRINEAKERIFKEVNEIIESLESGKKPYYADTMDYDEMCQSIKEQHGKDYSNGIKEYYNNHSD